MIKCLICTRQCQHLTVNSKKLRGLLEILILVSLVIPTNIEVMVTKLKFMLIRKVSVCLQQLVKEMYDVNFARENYLQIKYWLGRNAYVIADSGYQGLQNEINVITPHKKPKNDELSPIQKQHNKALSSRRIIVENYFGRLTGKFKLMKDIYLMEHGQYSNWVKLGYALTNYDVLYRPLRRNVLDDPGINQDLWEGRAETDEGWTWLQQEILEEINQ
ncbi:Conserved_hypothetical protein [Hexamita inflata]|uniref:DDE Tnp4 domain-containing protein n=1 Tax=Hexamita inflata TaxID=28002 RepID=A0AA86U929_9EUKA|nr:Conserved hypothetical protein [Hexamita inflata]